MVAKNRKTENPPLAKEGIQRIMIYHMICLIFCSQSFEYFWPWHCDEWYCPGRARVGHRSRVVSSIQKNRAPKTSQRISLRHQNVCVSGKAKKCGTSFMDTGRRRPGAHRFANARGRLVVLATSRCDFCSPVAA